MSNIGNAGFRILLRTCNFKREPTPLIVPEKNARAILFPNFLVQPESATVTIRTNRVAGTDRPVAPARSFTGYFNALASVEAQAQRRPRRARAQYRSIKSKWTGESQFYPGGFDSTAQGRASRTLGSRNPHSFLPHFPKNFVHRGDRSPQGSSIRVGGREVVNFCANNYLGLANHPEIVEAAHERGLRLRVLAMRPPLRRIRTIELSFSPLRVVAFGRFAKMIEPPSKALRRLPPSTQYQTWTR